MPQLEDIMLLITFAKSWCLFVETYTRAILGFIDPILHFFMRVCGARIKPEFLRFAT